MDKELIIAEMKRAATVNNGKPLGRRRLESECGIRTWHWQEHWALFSDVQRAAGFEPNAKNSAYCRTEMLAALMSLTRQLNRVPTTGDLRVKTANDPAFPDTRTVQRTFGDKDAMIEALSIYCASNVGYEDLAALFVAKAVVSGASTSRTNPKVEITDGFVYLIKSGRFYKIGKTNAAGRRERELAIQLPEQTKTVHVIKTDDPSGIEEYWHRRFAAKRKNGDWFDLAVGDISAFRRRKFM